MALTQQELQFIHDFGQTFYSSGQKALSGQIIGLLIVRGKEVITLDEIVKNLNVSKGPVSQCVRELCVRNLLQKKWIKGERKNQYQLAPEAWTNSIALLLAPLRQRLRIIETFLQAESPEESTSILNDVHKTYSHFLKKYHPSPRK